MTLAIGFNLGAYVILAADTRVSYFPPDGAFRFEDDREKLIPTSMGLATGAGLVNWLDAVKTRWAAEDLYDTNGFVRIIREERGKLPIERWRGMPHVSETLARTCWLFTYFKINSLDNFDLDTVRIRLAVCEPENDYNVGIADDNSCLLVLPAGLSMDQQQHYNDLCTSAIRPLSSISDVQQNLAYHVAFAAALVDQVAKINQTVSPTFQFGCHTLTQICLSSVLSLTHPQYTLDCHNLLRPSEE